MSRIILVRHGRTVLNAEDRLRGLADPELDSIGIDQAKAVAADIAHLDPHGVWSSPLKRAVRTATIIADAAAITHHVDARLNDRDYGEWTGELRSEVIRLFGRVDAAPGVEPQSDVFERVWPAVVDAAQTATSGPVVLVSHDAVLRPILESIMGGTIDETIAPGSCHLISEDGNRWSVQAMNWKVGS